MADIDKALPNVKQTLNIPNPEEVAVAEQEIQQDTEIQLTFNRMKTVV